MPIEINRDDLSDAILAGEGDGPFAAWTVQELEDDLGSLRSAFAQEDAAAW